MNHLAMADVPTRSGELPAYRLRRVAQYIRENAGRELRLAELSAVVHMSPYHFARLFKRSTGVSPHRFLVQHRIDQARTLLAARKASIAEIAQAVGFRTPSHFATTFRRLTRMAPSEYRSSGARWRHRIVPHPDSLSTKPVPMRVSRTTGSKASPPSCRRMQMSLQSRAPEVGDGVAEEASSAGMRRRARCITGQVPDERPRLDGTRWATGRAVS
jgi:AraC-like DNA-binding protein